MPPLSKKAAADLIKRRSPEWSEHEKRWRFVQDSLEGGNRFRYANYLTDPLTLESNSLWYVHGWDVATSVPYTIAFNQYIDANLVPHLSEMTPEGRDLYALRLARTPVPDDLRRVVERHLARVFSREPIRDTPDAGLKEWWEDVDGEGTKIDQWMATVVGPLLLVLGQLDLCFDHPAPPEGVAVRTRADMARHRLDRCVAGYVLPENLVWWEMARGTCCYEEVLIFERFDGGACWRHWTEAESNAYDFRGQWLEERSYKHRFKCVPIRRVFTRKKARCRNVGQSQYEATAELQKAIYNLHSELTLIDIQQSGAQLMGPEDFAQAGADVPVGPGNFLVKKKTMMGGSVHYEPWEYLDPPATSQEALRQHIQDLRDQIDRSNALTKPAGATQQGTVAQSGLSKSFDFQEGNDLLMRLAQALADAEVRVVAPLVLTVLRDGPPDPEVLAATTIVYPKEFGLQAASDVADRAAELQSMAEGAGQLPETEKELIGRHISYGLTGLTDKRLGELRAEVAGHVEEKARRRQEAAEGMGALTARRAEAKEEEEEYAPGGSEGQAPSSVDGSAMFLGGEPS